MKRTTIDASQMELNGKIMAIKRVFKIIKGGRIIGFSALVVIGDGNGHVGTGLGKADEVPGAVHKGKEAVVKNLVEIPVDGDKSIPCDFIDKFRSAAVLLKRTPEDTGVIAGGLTCSVLGMAGIKNIRTKSLGSNNKTNIILTTLVGLTSLRTSGGFAKLRDESVERTAG